MNLLEINNVSKSYNQNILLRSVNLSCKTGDIIGLFGRNGSGKSTFLKIIFGIVKSQNSIFKVNSILILNTINSGKVAYLPQHNFLPKRLKVYQVIELFFSDDAINHEKIRSESFISTLLNRKIYELSLGELKYLEVFIISYLPHPFLMLDEPFSMVDPLFKKRMKNLLLEISKTKGIIITDHYYQDILEISTTNLLLKNGTLVLIENLNDLKTASYLS